MRQSVELLEVAHDDDRRTRPLEPLAPERTRTLTLRADEALKRTFDAVASAFFLVLLLPVIVVIAAAIKLDSPGPVFFRSNRTGYRGRRLEMLKFRKMHATARGPALTLSNDARLTRVGRLLAQYKLDELPQLWNVVRGDMSLVGPRPEDPSFAALRPREYGEITQVRPGVTGLSQLAFVEESRILDQDDRVGHYVEQLLPQKIRMDRLYANERTIGMDLRIVFWTVVALVFRVDVAVNRETGRLGVRRRRNGPEAAGRAR